MLAHLAQAPMPWPMFTRLIDQLAASGLYVEKQISFGLFGDGLMDPLVVERARYVKKMMPDVFLAINTNGGPFNERRHGELIGLVDRFSVHIEGITPEIYERLMPPLRAENVFPKVERLLELAPGKVNIACPISSVNVDDFPALREHWESRGAHEVHILTFTNRTTDKLGFYDYALAPTAGCCRQEVAYDFIVDWDGKVLACCQDFTRGNEIGDLNHESVGQILANAKRRELFDALGNGQWSRFSSCRNCKFDHEGKVNDRLAEAAETRRSHMVARVEAAE
jgi:radical SAM protein with 4Fe4S-binding SPASM domain